MIVRLVNPPGTKSLTLEQVAHRQAQAVQFTRNVVGDQALADEIESLSAADYAARKDIMLENSNNGSEVKNDMATQNRTSQDAGLDAKLDRLTEAVEQLRGSSTGRRPNPATQQPEDLGAKLDKLTEAIDGLRSGRMSNPIESLNGMPSARAERRVRKLRSERDSILESLQEVQDLMDEDQLDQAQDALDEILDKYEIDLKD